MTAGTSPATDTAGTPTAPDEANLLSRRAAFAMCSFGLLGAATLTACGASSSGTSSADATTGEAAAATEGAPAASGAAADATTGGASSSATVLTKLSAVPVGGSLGVNVGDKPVIVSQPTAGTAVAFSAVCPHQGGTVAPNGKILKCPLHGSTFEDATGKNLSGPAAGRPLTPIQVQVTGGNVVLA